MCKKTSRDILFTEFLLTKYPFICITQYCTVQWTIFNLLKWFLNFFSTLITSKSNLLKLQCKGVKLKNWFSKKFRLFFLGNWTLSMYVVEIIRQCQDRSENRKGPPRSFPTKKQRLHEWEPHKNRLIHKISQHGISVIVWEV